jgi:hypothetical protein
MIVADLTVAVEVGIVLAALLYIHRVSQTTTVEWVTDDYIREGLCTFCRTSRFRGMSLFFVSMALPFRDCGKACGSDLQP